MPPSLELSTSPAGLESLVARGWRVDGNGFTTRRPDQVTIPLVSDNGRRVVAKFLPPDRGERTFANMTQLWNSSFGQRRTPPGLPQPIDFLPDSGALLMERLDGRPLAETRSAGPAHFEASLQLLAALHSSDARPETRRSSRAIVRSAERKAARIAELDPASATLARSVAEAISATRAKERELVPSHGDFSPRNVLVDGERVALIDWDRFQLADPARDVVYFGTSDWAEWLRRGRAPRRDKLQHAVALYEAARPGVKLKHSLSFHIAASCLRRAASVLELWPEQAWLAPAWLRTALRELESSP